jgi:hypothetical protein
MSFVPLGSEISSQRIPERRHFMGEDEEQHFGLLGDRRGFHRRGVIGDDLPRHGAARVFPNTSSGFAVISTMSRLSASCTSASAPSEKRTMFSTRAVSPLITATRSPYAMQ